MERPDVIVLGGGVSGLAYAFRAAKAGQEVLVVEREAGRVGGCLHSHRLADGYWFELGAHTTYNSYGGLLAMVEGTDFAGKLLQRGPARARFGIKRGGEWRWLSPPKVLLQLRWLDLLLHAPFGILAGKEGKTVEQYYTRLLGPRNFREIISPFFSTVPSQTADAFPVEGPGALFKKRPRREEYPRSFGVQGGLQALCEAVASLPGITVEGGLEARRVSKAGAGFAVELSDGRTIEAARCAIATPAPAAAALVERDWPRLSAAIRRIGTVTVETLGVVVPREKVTIPEVAFLVDSYYSGVTRDTFPDARWRAFAFHFRERRVSREEKLRVAAECLGIGPADFAETVEASRTLPAPRLEQGAILAEMDAALAGESLAVTGNYMLGMSIEECVQRSFAEWERVAG
ncbi:MAG TPA: FAD-dependent oxidoreductase [Anaeromyxobacteraceae bacterium]|nr:FAD-dependent oxidoreductase [Anaeromyxobacteraceae bacterium]